MKSPIRYLLLLVSIICLLSSCRNEEDLSDFKLAEEGVAEVDLSLAAYFQNFEAEALKRGIVIDLDALNISGEFQEISKDGVAGTCTYGSHQPGQIVIDQTFWNQAGFFLREMIVFHELGHCALLLDHREGQNADGTCASIMRSGLEACRDNYQVLTRADYLDELFGQSR